MARCDVFDDAYYFTVALFDMLYGFCIQCCGVFVGLSAAESKGRAIQCHPRPFLDELTVSEEVIESESR